MVNLTRGKQLVKKALSSGKTLLGGSVMHSLVRSLLSLLAFPGLKLSLHLEFRKAPPNPSSLVFHSSFYKKEVLLLSSEN